MKSIDQYDISEAFGMADVDCEQVLNIKDVHDLFLGLGYQPESITVSDLQRAAGGLEQLTLPQVLSLFGKFERSSRTTTLQETFDLLSNNKGYLTAEDVAKLSNEMGEPVDPNFAARMVAHFSSDTDSSGADHTVISLTDFQRFMSPPEP